MNFIKYHLSFAVRNVFMWSKNDAKHTLFVGNERGSANNRTTLIESDHTLIITNVQPEDEGNYLCKVVPEGIDMTAKLIIIPVNGGALEKPSAQIQSADGRDISERSITFRQGERIEIICKGRPETTDVKWFSGENRVAVNDNVQIDGNRLIIKKAGREHNRSYSCLIEGGDGNDVGTTSVTINVHCKLIGSWIHSKAFRFFFNSPFFYFSKMSHV